MILGPGNHEIGNTSKFLRDGKKPMPDSDSATQNQLSFIGFVKFANFCWPVL